MLLYPLKIAEIELETLAGDQRSDILRINMEGVSV